MSAGRAALDELRYIRSTMESAGAFTSVPGWAMVGLGLSAVVASVVAGRQADRDHWVLVWIIEAAFAAVVAVLAVAVKSRRRGLALTAGPNRRFASSFAPAMVTGAILTFAMWSRGVPDLLPGTWLLAFGASVTAGSVASVAPVRVLGVTFVTLGAVAFLLPTEWGDAILAFGFGGVLAAFGAVIARRHGG
jgi:predicted MFS family arabinose efflux permease